MILVCSMFGRQERRALSSVTRQSASSTERWRLMFVLKRRQWRISAILELAHRQEILGPGSLRPIHAKDVVLVSLRNRI